MEPERAARLRALHQVVDLLAAPADQQTASLPGTVVPDELALDFDTAWRFLPTLEREDGVVLDTSALRLLRRLHQLLSAPPGSAIWSDEALRDHPTWREIRVLARTVKPRLPPLAT